MDGRVASLPAVSRPQRSANQTFLYWHLQTKVTQCWFKTTTRSGAGAPTADERPCLKMTGWLGGSKRNSSPHIIGLDEMPPLELK